MKVFEYIIDKFDKLTDKIGKHNVMLIIFVVIVLAITGLYSTFSLFTSEEGINVVNGLKSYKFILDPSLEETSVLIPANTDKNVDVVVSNKDNLLLKYGLYYNSSNSLVDVSIGYLETSLYPASGEIDIGNDYTISLKIVNNSLDDVVINFGVSYGLKTGGLLRLPENADWVTVFDENNSSIKVNAPNLDNGLIPVFFDETTDEWKKADSENLNNSWYDYSAKMWANAVLVSEDTRLTYQDAELDAVIKESDILGFYVWIPRFKYRVWNINRQAVFNDESLYAYPAYSKGIDIMWEKEDRTTGNIGCTYNSLTTELETNLSDNCIYNNIDNITVNSLNTNYQDAWYTHPAFTFGNKDITGFWIGKFETSGTEGAPVILPDSISLKLENLSSNFEAAKVFQKYGLTDNVEAHMLTNLEWGAVSYLTHSIYGLCDAIGCRDVYINNSSLGYTGRSGGAIAGSENLELFTVYDTEEQGKYNSYGYYNYKGYFIDSIGNVTDLKDITKVASTTGNITGVYDMAGGTNEFVMSTIHNVSDEIYDSTGIIKKLESKYYNSYSYGTTLFDKKAYNRSRLGDATAEVIFGLSNSLENGKNAWKSIDGTSGSISAMPSGIITEEEQNDYSWIIRGGSYDIEESGIYYFNGTSSLNSNATFRSVIS